MNMELYCMENDKPVMFVLSPRSFIGYETCAWSITGKHCIMRLLFDTYHEWIINLTDKTAVHVISNLADGIERHLYTFDKLVIR